MANDLPIGNRIRQIRRRRALSQEQLADLSGVSLVNIRRLEQNKRQSARIDTLHAIARALDVRLSELFEDSRYGLADDIVDINLWDLRKVLVPATEKQDIPAPEEPDLAALATQLSTAARAFYAVDYGRTAGDLPNLIESAQAAVDYYRGQDEEAEALRYLAQAYRITASFLMNLRQDDLAYWSVMQSKRAASRAGDDLLDAEATAIFSRYLLRQARFDDSENVARRSAEAVEPAMMSASPRHMATWGTLLLRASAAAVRNNKYEAANDLLGLARMAASRTEVAVSSRISFGPTVVGAIAVENALISGDAELALRVAGGIQKSRNEPVHRWSRHLLTVAQAELAMRNYDKAIAAMKEVNASAPEWLRHQHLGHQLMVDLLDTVTVRRAKESGLVTIATSMQIRP
jgi:transcriptional regulator with XRE-family HTH domain